MINYVLGAPGSGKSLIIPRLRRLMPDRVVLDWDALMEPAGDLAGAPIPQTPRTWEPYGRLVRTVVDAILPVDLVLLGVCTPAELADWPTGSWLLLDCSDEVRRQRLTARNEPDDIDDVLRDAANYRALGLPVVDTTYLSPDEVATSVVDRTSRAAPTFRRDQQVPKISSS
ncbi:DEAD/DEAH box helicase family protein [Microlunatus soli]|uniref:AAA domain-containing protein n=1 Tax=Microlunatus soli TaxID=630515 RepID=A0A1H1YUH4_9ACTN|nr:AAA family ATPase [Microlunatus soli]SDT25030.1 hypothetical protein SAMN04489812_4788 [Microlunatus soli]